MTNQSIKDMPKTRDDQRYEEQRKRILDAALEVFSRFGYRGATNKRIAIAAGGIAPGLIYHYFADKQALFRAALEEAFPLLQMTSHPEALIDLPLREALRQIAYGYLKIFEREEVRRGMRLMVATLLLEDNEVRVNIVGQSIGRVFTLLANYFRAQIDAGRLRPVDPEIAARAFLGPFAVTAMTRYLLEQPTALAIANDELVDSTVNIFLDGLGMREDQA